MVLENNDSTLLCWHKTAFEIVNHSSLSKEIPFCQIQAFVHPVNLRFKTHNKPKQTDYLTGVDTLTLIS